MGELLPVRGLTIIQPWASLIASGQKTIESRKYPTKYRGWLLIHAGKRWEFEEQKTAVELLTNGAVIPNPILGAAVAVARLVRCDPFMDTPREVRNATSRLLRARGGISNPDLDAEITPGFSVFYGLRGLTCAETYGLWSWRLEDMIALPDPVPWKGSQGLWIPRGTKAAWVGRQLLAAGHPAAGAFAALK